MIGSTLAGANAPNLSGKKKFNIQNLLENPMFMGGLGLLGSGGQNSFQHALLGLQSASGAKDQRLGRERDSKEDEYKASRRKRESLLDTRQDEQYQQNQEFKSAFGSAISEGDKETALQLLVQNKPEAAFQVLQGDKAHQQKLDLFGLQNQARAASREDSQAHDLDMFNRNADLNQFDAQRALSERVALEDYKSRQKTEQAKIAKQPKLQEELQNLEALEADVLRAQEILTTGGNLTGPLVGRMPSVTDDAQELEAVLTKLGIGRLDAFKGSLSEKEMQAAFGAGANMNADAPANMKLLEKQLEAVQKSKQRIQSELGVGQGDDLELLLKKYGG